MSGGLRPLLLAAAAFCGAVLFRSSFLRYLFVFQIVLFAALLVQGWLQQSAIEAVLLAPRNVVRQGEKLTVIARVSSRSSLPVPRLIVRVGVHPFPEGEVLLMKGMIMLDVRESGNLRFEMDGAHCGSFDFTADEIEISDILGLFSWRRRLSYGAGVTVSILPKNACGTVDTISDTDPVSGGRAQESGTYLTDALSADGFDIRKYHFGDSKKWIHWKLSARMDDLLIRAASDENMQPEICIYLDLCDDLRSPVRLNPEAWDHFMTCVDSVGQRLLERYGGYSIVWWSKEQGSECLTAVADYESHQNMLCALLRVQTYSDRLFSAALKEIGCHEEKTSIWIDLQGRTFHPETERSGYRIAAD